MNKLIFNVIYKHHVTSKSPYVLSAYGINAQLDSLHKIQEELKKSLVHAQNHLHELEETVSHNRKELIALRMFYLSTKLASQVSSDNTEDFEKNMQRVLYAEQKILELQNN